MSLIEFKISVPTDNGYLGRECNSPSCKKYFKVHSGSIKSEMHCPYCGMEFSNNELHTQDQVGFLEESGKELATAYAHAEINKMLGNFAKQFSGNKFIKMTHTPSNFQPEEVKPQYSEHKVDSELSCPECGFLFQVFGIFGYCPGCSSENMLIYDANISIIRKEITDASDKARALRHAYADLVTTFENFCTKKAADIPAKSPSFQDIFEARRFFKVSKSIDILEGFSIADNLCARRIFQKRHVQQHAAGIINEKYIRKIPEDANLLGMNVELSESEFEDGCLVIRRAVGILAGGRLN